MKRLMVIFCIFVLMFAFAGGASAAPLRVAVVVAGGLGDKSFYDSSDAGFRKAVKELGIQGKVIECKYDAANYVPYLAAAAKNFDMVFIVGFEIVDALTQVAPQFPKTEFVQMDMSGKIAHVSFVNFKENEGSFLAGALATMMTNRSGDPRVNKKEIIGAVGGQDIPVIRNFITGYEQGARYVNPKIKVISGFVGNWDDPSKGKEMALAQHSQGADVIFQIAGGSGQGVITASKEKKFYSIGVDSPQEHLAPGSVLTSMVKRCDVAVFSLIKDKIDGKYKRGHTYVYGLKEKGVGLSLWTEEAKKTVPADVIAKIEKLEKDIVSGKIKVNSYKEKKN